MAYAGIGGLCLPVSWPSVIALCNDTYMITYQEDDRAQGWFAGRVSAQWGDAVTETAFDREEITAMITLDDIDAAEGASEAEISGMRSGRAKAFREDTRATRMMIAQEAEALFGRKVSWGVRIGDHREVFTHLAVPVMTRLKQAERQVLDTLIDAGVARSRSEALAWCVRLVQRHSDDWLTELREAMTHVDEVKSRGPA